MSVDLPESPNRKTSKGALKSALSNLGAFASDNLSVLHQQISTVCILGALQRQVDLQGVFVKIGDSIKFKGFLVEFLENMRS